MALFPELEKKTLVGLDLLLQLQHAIEQGFGRWWTSRDINVDGDNAIASSDDGIGIVIVATAIGAAAHRHHPTRFWHLIVHLQRHERRVKIRAWSKGRHMKWNGKEA